MWTIYLPAPPLTHALVHGILMFLLRVAEQIPHLLTEDYAKALALPSEKVTDMTQVVVVLSH